MIHNKLACLAAATVIGATLMAVPAQARGGGGFGGGGGMHGGGGFGGGGGMHGGGGFGGGGGMHGGAGFASVGGMHAGGFGGFGGFGGMRGAGFAAPHVGGFAGIGPGFAGRSAFVGRPAFNHGFFPGKRFAFFPRRRFIAPFFGAGALYAADYSSCWTWVPTVYGWRRIWACDYDYGSY